MKMIINEQQFDRLLKVKENINSQTIAKDLIEDAMDAITKGEQNHALMILKQVCEML